MAVEKKLKGKGWSMRLIILLIILLSLCLIYLSLHISISKKEEVKKECQHPWVYEIGDMRLEYCRDKVDSSAGPLKQSDFVSQAVRHRPFCQN